MFLKRLDLHGFKSFAHKTAIEFLPGVTIVVGPNGCGKSNVLDAMRWVLGETSAKSLRGAKMGDVVFRGSASMKPAHFAQVNLVVNNEAQHLKMDHSEVVVTRRLFSNGDSEFQINKQKGRMRDVHELFLDTGLGADGYAIIEQGQIGAMVSAKPGERRELFEEAAGISRYKARREETLRKLVRTEEDLVRLFDIVSEVERSCNSLYRQAKKAERHRRLTQRLYRLTRHMVVLRHRLLVEQLEELRPSLEGAHATLEQARATVATLEAENAETARRMEDYTRKHQDLSQQRFDLQETLNREQRRVENSQRSIESATEAMAMLDGEIASSKNRILILEDTIRRLSEELEKESSLLIGKQERVESLQVQYDGLRSEASEGNTHLLRLRQDLDLLRRKESKVREERSVAGARADALRHELEERASKQEALEKERDEAEAGLSEAQRLHGEASARVTSLKETFQNLRSRIQDADSANDKLSRDLEEATRIYNKAASRLQALQEVEDSYDGYFRGVQVVMKASQGGRLRGIIGVLTSLLSVPKEYEVAVEVALGGSLQDIVTQSERDAQEAIKFLREHREGRATFLPLDLLQSNTRTDHLMAVRGRSGVIGLAKELIRYDAQIEKAVDRRLGSTLVVDRLQTAVELQRSGVRNRYVSLEGDLVDPSGVLTGGSHQSRGLLSRSREIRSLRDEVASFDHKRQSLAAELASARGRLSQDQARFAEVQAQLHEAQMAETRAEKDRSALEARAKERRNELASLDARLLQQRLDLEKYEEVQVRCNEALSTLVDQIASKESLIGEMDGFSRSRSEEIARLGDELGSARSELAIARDRIASVRSKIEELRRDASGSDQEQESRAERRRLQITTIERATAERQQAELLVGELAREKEALEAALSSLEQENASLKQTASQFQSRLQLALRERNQRENAFRELEMKELTLKTEIGVIRREAEDEFAESIEDIAASLKEKATTTEEALVSPDGVVEESNEREIDAIPEEDEELIGNPTSLRQTINELRDRLSRMGAVNENAIEEYREQKDRLDFLIKQRDDLIAAKDSLTETIRQLDETTTRLFHEAFEAIRQNFRETFRRLFNGGNGDLLLVEEEGYPEPGIDIFAQPPGKSIGGSLTLMSGGEKAMTAIALMLSLFQFRPSPICVLDEIDAPLDDANCQRLCDALKEYAKTTQFLIITHNKITMSLADTIYGVTMQEPGISKLVSVRFEQIDESGLIEKTG